jgi:hypothetical protein
VRASRTPAPVRVTIATKSPVGSLLQNPVNGAKNRMVDIQVLWQFDFLLAALTSHALFLSLNPLYALTVPYPESNVKGLGDASGTLYRSPFIQISLRIECYALIHYLNLLCIRAYILALHSRFRSHPSDPRRWL